MHTMDDLTGTTKTPPPHVRGTARDRAHIPDTISSDASRLCSFILNRLAFCRPASVRKPAQRMAGEHRGRISRRARRGLHHQRHALRAHRLFGQPALQSELAKDGAGVDPGLFQPGSVMTHRLPPAPVEDRDGVALALLIGLGGGDAHQQPAAHPRTGGRW